MTTHAQAREILKSAFAKRGLQATLPELQIVGAIALLESIYGDAYGSAHNWGSIQSGHKPPCPPGTFQHGDSSPTTGGYQACFKAYPTQEDGAADLVRELYRRPGVKDAAQRGDSLGVARAMYESHYYEGFGPTPAARIYNYGHGIQWRAAQIAKALGEPLAVQEGGRGSVLAGVGTMALFGGLAVAAHRFEGWLRGVLG